MNVDLIEVNKPRARTAEEVKLEAILRGLKAGDFFYLPDGATSTDATELAELGQSIGVNVVARSERRIGHPPCWRIVCLEPGSDEPSLDEFLAAHTEQGAAFKCKLSDLWESYRLAHAGEPPLGKRQFGRALTDAGFPYVKVLNYMVRLGLRLKPRGSADALISALAEGQAMPKSVAAKKNAE